MDDVPTALRHAVRCLDDEGLVVVCDSVLNRGLLSLEQIERLLAPAPRRVLRLLDRCDGRAESGPESMVRLRLRSRTVRVRPQVVIDGVGRGDLLVGRGLIIEIDGFVFHGDRSGFERDRLRDVRAHELGYTPLRFTYRQVVYDWPETECAIMNAIHAGAHHRPARRV